MSENPPPLDTNPAASDTGKTSLGAKVYSAPSSSLASKIEQAWDVLPGILWKLSTQGVVLDVNQAALDFSGHSKAEFTGHLLDEFFSMDSHSKKLPELFFTPARRMDYPPACGAWMDRREIFPSRHPQRPGARSSIARSATARWSAAQRITPAHKPHFLTRLARLFLHNPWMES